MTRNNRAKKRTKTKQPRQPGAGDLSAPMRSLTFREGNPGRARLRGAVELVNGVRSVFLSYEALQTWFPKASSLLTPFVFFRIAEMEVSVRVAGGAGSAYSVVYNVSNTYQSDTTAVTILDDDFSALSTGAMTSSLRPPASFWRDGARRWYNVAVQSGGEPSNIDLTPASIGTYASGAATTTPATVVGWLIVDVVLEFHTLT